MTAAFNWFRVPVVSGSNCVNTSAGLTEILSPAWATCIAIVVRCGTLVCRETSVASGAEWQVDELELAMVVTLSLPGQAGDGITQRNVRAGDYVIDQIQHLPAQRRSALGEGGRRK